jgi:hypothetical protein
VTRYNSRGMRSASWKLKAAAGGAAVVAGVGGGLALTNHPTAVHDSAYSFGFGQGGYGNMLSSAVSNLQQGGVSSGVSLRALQELGAIRGFGTQFNVWKHHQRSRLAFQRGQIVLITHHFLVVRGLNGRLTVWKISGNTAIKNVAVTPTAQAVAPVAAVPVLTTGTAATAVTGAMPVTTVLNNTAVAAPTTTTVSVTTGTTTVTVTITNTPAAATVAPVAKVVTPTTTTVMPTAALTWKGLVAGDLVFVAGSQTHHTLTAQLVLIEATATVTPTVTPTITATPTVTPTTTVKPTVTPTVTTPAVTPTVTVTPTAPAVGTTASPSTTPTNS